MALEPGGYADKVGNRYEGSWVVRQLLCVLNETLRSVEIEAVGADQDGIDLCVEFPSGIRRAQQCKIRNGSNDKWSIADLSRRGILAAMRAFLDKSDSNEFQFVTAIPSTTLHDLCESARSSKSDSEVFYEYQVRAIGGDRHQVFSQFCARLNLDKNSLIDRATAFSYLQRLFIELWPDNNTSRIDLLQNASTIINGNPNTAISVLAQFATANLRRILDATNLWAHLESSQLYPRRLENDARITPAVKAIQTRFKESIAPDLVGGELIHRDETDALIAALASHGVVILHGGPGQGKSSILYELVTILEENGSPYIPIRLDRQEPKNTPQQFGKDLDLPESPANCLNALSNDRLGVLILDQLDAIRWTSRHSVNALDVCKSLVREIRAFRELGGRVSVVLACRTYDLQNDPEIKSWLRAEKLLEDQPVEVGVSHLPLDAVRSVVTRLGGSLTAMSDRQVEILRSPQHLSLWVWLVEEYGGFEFQNRTQLIRAFWKNRMAELRQRGIEWNDASIAMNAIVDYMEVNGKVAAPRSIATDQHILAALHACGLLKEQGGQVTFSHQSYLDFQIANRVVYDIFSSGRSVVEWLGDRKGQSLFRREQLRQALCLLNEESPEQFLRSVKDIISGSGIRFHLKHLCLEVLGQLDNPSDTLLEFLHELSQHAEWKHHVFSAVYFRRPAYMERLVKRGAIQAWLESDQWRDYGLWLLRGAASPSHYDLAAVLRPYLNRDDEWNNRILATLPWTGDEESDEVFTLRADLARLGTFRDYIEWAKLTRERALVLFSAIVSSWDTSIIAKGYDSHNQSRLLGGPLSDEDRAILTSAVREQPTKAWESLIAEVCRLAPVEDWPDNSIELWIEDDYISRGHFAPHALVNLTIESGKELARTNAVTFWDRTAEVRKHPSQVVQYILVESYEGLGPEYAEAAIEWVLSDKSRLSVGTGREEPEWAPAARLIRKLSSYCSEELFRNLENAIVHFKSPDQLRSARYWLGSWRRGYFGDYWGRAQHFLLPALCPERCTKQTIGLIGVLERKYETYPRERFLRRSGARGGFVQSTLRANLDRISDNAWLGIVTSEKVKHGKNPIKHWHDHSITESSTRYFSQDLARVAKRFPQRFGHLALRFPTDIDAQYQAAIIEGVTNIEAKDVPENEKSTWTPAPISLVEAVLSKFGKSTTRSYAISFCWLMFHRSEEKWSDLALDQLSDFACNHQDPSQEQLVIGNENGTFDASEATIANLTNNSLNSVRAVAALAIGEQLRDHPDLIERFRFTIEHLCNDPHPSVRIAGLDACRFLLDSEKDFAISLFYAATSVDLRVAASNSAVTFFNVGMQSHREVLSPIVLAMLRSHDNDVVQQGAAEIGARWLFHDYFKVEMEECLAGTVSQRLGLASIAAAFVHKTEYTEKCVGLIEHLKNDPDKAVRDTLRAFVRSIDVLNIPAGNELMIKFIESQAFLDDPTPLLFTLSEYQGKVSRFSEVLFAICHQIVGPLCDVARDPTQGVMHDLPIVLRMLIRLYEEANEERNTENLMQCLDFFDSIFERRLGSASEIAQIVG